MVEEIRAQQVNRARPVTGKGFALGVASVVLRRDDDVLVCVAQCRPNTAPTSS